MITPTLETERLRLRAHRVSDMPASVELWGQPSVNQYLGGRPSTPQQSWVRLLSYVGHWQLMAFGYWAVEEKMSGRYLGEVGLAECKRELFVDSPSATELGWIIDPSAQGRGYATEAARAALKWADQNLPVRRTICLIEADNVKSLRVATKCGYRELERVHYAGSKTFLMARDAAPIKRETGTVFAAQR